MSKDVLISIRPRWVEKICHRIGEENGKPVYEKRIEVRKTRPKLETPFKCYIYMTQGKVKDLGTYSDWVYENRMKVIGEFICDRVLEWECKNLLVLPLPTWRASYMVFVDELEKTCLTYDDLWNYGKGKTLYGWHISDLKIYDKPKELSEFTPVCEYKGERCDNCEFYAEQFGGCCRTLSRPPQSWCYVEVEE